MFACPVCDEWIIATKICHQCDIIRQLCKIYGRDKLIEVLNKTMIIQQLKGEE